MQPYVDYVQTNGISTHVAGTYNGRDPFTPDLFKQQTYNFSATIDAATNLVLTGSCGVGRTDNDCHHKLGFIRGDLQRESQLRRQRRENQ
ncbi:MAG: hypothetical protein WDM76_03835 [Limisphaerales bacterium]